MLFEDQYKKLIEDILDNGEFRKGRNGNTFSLFGKILTFDSTEDFPLLVGRQVYYKGVLGELAAFLRQPKNIKDFEDFGCNYWKLWAKEDGSINVDYGNKWLEWNGTDQLARLIETLKTNPTDRRMIINSWDPSNIDNLDLPCCHYSYQWYVRDGTYLDMIWNQRSVDTMIGLPSDAVFAAVWNAIIANEVGLVPGKITMVLADTHIYEEHVYSTKDYLETDTSNVIRPSYQLLSEEGKPVTEFVPEDIQVIDYYPVSKLKFKLKD